MIDKQGAEASNGQERVIAKSYGYDAAGRTTSVVTSAGTTSLTYDYEGRITGITYPSSATNSFTYNGLDTRVGKVDSSGTATYKRDGAGVTAPVLSDGSAAFTPGLSQRASSTSTFFHGGIKNTDTQTSSSKSVTATRVYDAFGNIASSTGTWSSPFGYAGPFGYQEDNDNGLKLLGHRYNGRFLTRDDARAGRNWYAYCANNPLRRIDATGRNFHDSWLAVSTWVDDHLLGGAVADAGDAYGQWESGTGSGWTAAGKGLKAIGLLAVLAVAVVDGVAEAEAGEAGLAEIGEAGEATEAGEAEEAIGEGGCFIAGTQVEMADGTRKRIEQIKPGDRVKSRDQAASDFAPTLTGMVKRTQVHRHDGTLLLKFADGSTVHTTKEHPFYVHGRGFTPAGDLHVGDEVSEDGTQTDRIAAIVNLSATETVYNFEVAGSHTYFVKAGDAWLWVHNTCKRPSTRKIRHDWEKANNEEWPTDPETGKPKIAHHEQPVSEEGSHDPGNIRPVTPGEHASIHALDWAKWGKLGGSKRI